MSQKTNRKKKLLFKFFVLLLSFSIWSCSASKDAYRRYKDDYQVDIRNYSPLENFISNLPIDTISNKSEIWYKYEVRKIQKPIIQENRKLKIGYRIQVQISDEFLVIDSIKNEIYKILPNLPQYVIYDPPFYKLRLGDFDSKSQAIKYLNILEKNGYITSRIITDKLE